MKVVLIDSDVLLDILLLREDFLDNSIEILKLCELRKIQGCITAVILANSYYVMRRHFNDDEVRKSLKNLLFILDIIQISKPQILQALDSKFKDFEDALQNYSAEASGSISTIITRKIKDYKHSQLAVMTPELFLRSNY